MEVELQLFALHQVVNDRECQIRIDCARSVAGKQCEMHHLAGVGGFDDKCRLHAFLAVDQVMVHGRGGEQRRYRRMRGVGVAVGEHDIVAPFVDSFLRLFTQTLYRFAQSVGA